jgi:hypothetical protein
MQDIGHAFCLSVGGENRRLKNQVSARPEGLLRHLCHAPKVTSRGFWDPGPRGRTDPEDQGPWSSTRGTIPGMEEPPELRYNRHWRVAVWALRAGYVGLAVAISGIVVMSLGSTPWVLFVGVIIWLAAAVVTLGGVFWSRSELPQPRPGLWSTRFMLIHDTVHARSSAQRA